MAQASVDKLHLSQRSAEIAAQIAVTQKRCDAYRIVPRAVRNEDRSMDRGFAAIITLQGRAVGFA